MPYRSTAQQRWAHGTGQPFASRWDKETNFSNLPKKVRQKRKVRTKSFTLDQLEAFVSSKHYDPDTADLIASFIPSLKAAPAPAAAPAAAAPAAKPAPGGKGESLGPGITRIRGNLCNVHGRYGPCDGGGGAKKPKGKRKPRKPPKTDAQRAQERQQRQQARQAETTRQQALNMTKVGDDTGLGDDLANLDKFSQGKPLRQQDIDTLTKQGLLEIGSDGTPRKSEQANVLLNAAKRGDSQGAKDALSRAHDAVSRRADQAKRQQDAAGKRAAAQMDRQLRKQEADAKRAARLAKQQAAGGGGGGSKKPAPAKTGTPAPSSAGGGGGGGGGGAGGGATSRFSPAKPEPPPKPTKPTKAETTAANVASVRQRMAENDAGLAPSGVDALVAFAGGTQPNAQIGGDFEKMGLAERGADGAYHLTTDARSVVSAMNAGDYQKAVDAINSAQEKAAAAEAKRQAATTKAASNSPGDYLIVEDPNLSSSWHLQVKRGGTPDHGLMGSAWAALHSGFRGNVYQGPGKADALAKLKKLYASEDMPLPTEKAASFRVFKDAQGRWRWVSQSSTAFQDRDKEIVSTKALSDDCAWSDKTGQFGPLRWWHVPGLDLGDADFNAMHGRVLIESGTFRSEAIAQKVARAADGLEVSLGFLHLPSEPDADGVFHHIRKFERSLVPRGKASNRFTAFTVKELPMDEQKIAGLKSLGFSDDDIAALQGQAAATEKAAEDQKVAYKAAEPAAELQEVTIGGITYQLVEKAAQQPMVEGSPEEEAAESPAEEAAEPDAQMDDGSGDGLTLSAEDITAIGQAVAQAIQQALGPLVSTMDLTNKIGTHMDELKSMMGGYTAKKDAESAATTEQIAALEQTVKSHDAQLIDLLGLQPAVAPRASTAASTALNPNNPTDVALAASLKDQAPNQQFAFSDLVQNLFGTPGQAS